MILPNGDYIPDEPYSAAMSRQQFNQAYPGLNYDRYMAAQRAMDAKQQAAVERRRRQKASGGARPARRQRRPAPAQQTAPVQEAAPAQQTAPAQMWNSDTAARYRAALAKSYGLIHPQEAAPVQEAAPSLTAAPISNPTPKVSTNLGVNFDWSPVANFLKQWYQATRLAKIMGPLL